MKRFWVVTGLLLALTPGVGMAQQAPAATKSGGEEKRITLVLRDVPLRVALQTLFEGSGHQYAVNPDVPNPPISLELRDVPFQQALRSLIREGRKQVPGLTYSKG